MLLKLLLDRITKICLQIQTPMQLSEEGALAQRN
jgi:hypothetical protein